jgi:nitrile hydratase
VPVVLARGRPATRPGDAPPRFALGQPVRARNIHPTGHTRLPRYARGRLGRIERHHGVHVFPDANAHGLGERAQHLYGVAFAARELWGEAAAPADMVMIDLWEAHLEPA